MFFELFFKYNTRNLYNLSEEFGNLAVKLIYNLPYVDVEKNHIVDNSKMVVLDIVFDNRKKWMEFIISVILNI